MAKRKSEETMENVSDTISRNFQVASNINQKFWDLWMVNLGSISWLNDQWENMVQTYLSQRKAMRDEYIKVAEQMANQLQKNLNEVEEVLKEAWMTTAENVSVPAYKSYADLVKQVDELTKKMDVSK